MLYGKLSNESEQYQKARAELLEAEIALRDQRERVAELRRALPLDSKVDDYLFHEGPSDLQKDSPISEIRLSELFEDPLKPLVLYQYFYSASAIMKDNEYRGLDLLNPVWNFLDLTPEGRGDWLPSVQYEP